MFPSASLLELQDNVAEPPDVTEDLLYETEQVGAGPAGALTVINLLGQLVDQAPSLSRTLK